MKWIYDEFMQWPYHEPYGTVPAPQQKLPRKARALPAWLKEPRKQKRKKSRSHRRKLPEPLSPGKSEFVSCAMRECEGST